MSKVNDGGTAFPATERNVMHELPGMTLRDYFAAHAPAVPNWFRTHDQNVGRYSGWAFYYADAMLKAREA